jgi:hypothetical protein
MERTRTVKKTKPRLEHSGDLSLSGLPIILPTPTLKQLKPMDYRPMPVFSPDVPSVPAFDAAGTL